MLKTLIIIIVLSILLGFVQYYLGKKFKSLIIGSIIPIAYLVLSIWAQVHFDLGDSFFSPIIRSIFVGGAYYAIYKQEY